MSFNLVTYKNTFPSIDSTVYIGSGCAIIGAVEIKKKSSIWFNSVLRGDMAPIIIGESTNIQDGSVIHTSRFNGPVNIGNNVTIGHMALIHACTINDNAFIGMRTMLMDFVIVEEYGFVAAGSVVTPNKIVKSKELWMGSPAKCVRFITDKELDQMKDTTNSYVNLAALYLDNSDAPKPHRDDLSAH